MKTQHSTPPTTKKTLILHLRPRKLRAGMNLLKVPEQLGQPWMITSLPLLEGQGAPGKRSVLPGGGWGRIWGVGREGPSPAKQALDLMATALQDRDRGD